LRIVRVIHELAFLHILLYALRVNKSFYMLLKKALNQTLPPKPEKKAGSIPLGAQRVGVLARA
jgi:hypothetical protein